MTFLDFLFVLTPLQITGVLIVLFIIAALSKKTAEHFSRMSYIGSYYTTTVIVYIFSILSSALFAGLFYDFYYNGNYYHTAYCPDLDVYLYILSFLAPSFIILFVADFAIKYLKNRNNFWFIKADLLFALIVIAIIFLVTFGFLHASIGI
jgi:hypothetical protein